MLLSWYALRGEALRPPPCTPHPLLFFNRLPLLPTLFRFYSYVFPFVFFDPPFPQFLDDFHYDGPYLFFFDPSILFFFDPYLFFFDPLAGMDNSCLGSSNQHIKDSFMRLHSLDRMFSEVVIWKEVNLYSVVTSVIFPCF